MSLDCGGLTVWAASSLRSPRHGFGQPHAGLAERSTTRTGRIKRLAFDSERVLVGLSLAIASQSRQRIRSQPCLQRNVQKKVALETCSERAVEGQPDSDTLSSDGKKRKSNATAPVEAWLYDMSRREYLRKRIHPDLKESVADLSDLELFVLGLEKESEQAEIAARLRSLSTASGSRILGVPRSVYVEKRINKELCIKHVSQVASLSDNQLPQLGNVGAGLSDQERKLQELLEEAQYGLLGSQTSPRKEYVERQLAPAARTHGLHKLSDVGVYALAHKRPKDVKLFMEKLQDLEDRLKVQRIVLTRKVDQSLKDELCALDDVTLQDLAQKSTDEQRQWLQSKAGEEKGMDDSVQASGAAEENDVKENEELPEKDSTTKNNVKIDIERTEAGEEKSMDDSVQASHAAEENDVKENEELPEKDCKTNGFKIDAEKKKGISEEAKDESQRRLGKHESAVAQIVAREAKEGYANVSPSPKNGVPTPVAAKTEQPESTDNQKNERKKRGKHEEAVAQIVAKTKETKETVTANSPKNGVPLPSATKAESPEKTRKVQTASEKEFEAATVANLQSLFDRGCRLVALSVGCDLFRDSPIARIMVRENDTSRPPLVVSKAKLKKEKVRQILKRLLESDEVLKVVHDCPRVSDALHHQFQISLNNVFDTAIAWQVLNDSDISSRIPSVSQVLEKFGKIQGTPAQKAKLTEKPAHGAEKVLFDLMGMAAAASVSETRDDKEAMLLELKGLLVASIAMSKFLKDKDKSKTFKRLCQEGLRKFRQWPGQHVQALPLGEEAPFSFVDHKLVCHLRKESKELQKVVETVNSEQLAEDASAAAELKLLLGFLSKPVLEAVEAHWAEIGVQPMELVLSVGRQIEFRCRPLGEKRMRCDFLSHICSGADLDAVVKQIGNKNFTIQDRAGIDGTLHRISAVRNKTGTIVTLVMRIGRSSRIVAGLVEDILADSKSVLILGPPGVGKTTLLRACAARMSEDRPTVIVDPAGEIAGCGDEPHKSVGRSLKDMAYSPSRLSRSEARREAMTRVVENMTPKVLVVDEIGTKGEAFAARTIGERGVQLVATAHGHNLFDLLANTELRDLVGGIVTSTLGDDNKRVRESGRKTMSERSSRPVFSTLVELKTPFSVAVHEDVAQSVDAALMGRPIPVQVRTRDPHGQMHVKLAKI